MSPQKNSGTSSPQKYPDNPNTFDRKLIPDITSEKKNRQKVQVEKKFLALLVKKT